jgi:hypothetical protein
VPECFKNFFGPDFFRFFHSKRPLKISLADIAAKKQHFFGFKSA